MEVSTREVAGVTILDVQGEVLGGPESEPLRSALEAVLSRGDRRLLVVLAGAPWMNSAGLGIFLAAYSRLREEGGELRFAGVGSRVLQILRTTKLLSVFAVLDDEEAGVRSFRARDPVGPDRRPSQG